MPDPAEVKAHITEVEIAIQLYREAIDTVRELRVELALLSGEFQKLRDMLRAGRE